MKPYEISLDDERRIVRVTATGILTQSLGEEIITQARMTAAEHRYSILYDVRNTTVEVSLASWWFLPRELEVLQQSKTRFLKAAVLITHGETEQDYKFYETVMQNMQMKLRIFYNEDEAFAWLAN